MLRYAAISMAVLVPLSACGFAFEGRDGDSRSSGQQGGDAPSDPDSTGSAAGSSPSQGGGQPGTGGAMPNLGGGGGEVGGAGGEGGEGEICDAHSFGGRCYELLTADRSWADARAACQALGAGWDLMGYSGAAERDFLDAAESVSGQIWTAGRDVSSNDSYVWVNGEPWTFAPWGGAVEPDGGSEDCVRIIPNAGAANDTIHDTTCGTVFPHAWCEGPG